MAEALFIGGFKQPWSQCLMNLNSCVNDFTGEGVYSRTSYLR
jgi:hypothetical protein